MSFPLVGGSYASRSLNLDAQRTINLYPVIGESGTAKTIKALFGTPGKRLLVALPGAGGLRCLYRPTRGQAIAVRGSQVYRVAADWTYTLVGTIDGASTPVSIDDDGTIAVIVTGERGYFLNLTSNVLTEIVDAGFYGSDFVYYNKTVFIFNRPGTAQFYLASGVAGALVFDPLDFATATTNAEAIVRHIVDHEELFLFKETVTEVWRASGGPDFLFARDTNASIVKGCQAAHSVVALDNTVYWMGGDGEGDGVVWKMNGYTPQRVSNDGLEFAIQNYETTSDAWAYTYQQEGETFYVLTFPSANATWAFGVKAGEWHERAYLKPATGTLQRDRAVCHMLFAGTHVVGDWENGNLYALDLGYFTDNGDPMPAIRACPHISGVGYNVIKFKRIRIDIETGVGLENGYGSDPVMLLRWSDDGGHSWSNLKAMKMGKIGKTKTQAALDRLGEGRDRVFEVSIIDPVKRVILGAAVDAVDTGK